MWLSGLGKTNQTVPSETSHTEGNTNAIRGSHSQQATQQHTHGPHCNTRPTQDAACDAKGQ
jgi:hypothetical protein